MLTCKICNKEFNYKKESACKAQLTVHLRIQHKMTKEDYIVKTQYNGKHPICPCGCGKKLHLRSDGNR